MTMTSKDLKDRSQDRYQFHNDSWKENTGDQDNLDTKDPLKSATMLIGE